MIRSYLITAIRNLSRLKVNAFVNIVGLSIAIATSILILIWITHELSFENFHNKARNIYRVGIDGYLGRSFRLPITSLIMAPLLKEKLPEIDNYVRISRPEKVSIKFQDLELFDVQLSYADTSLFSIFSIQLLKGNTGNVLDAPNSLVISESFAKILFKDGEPVGEMVRIGGDKEFAITGVFKDMPENSHLSFDLIGSYETLFKENEDLLTQWLPFSVYTYLLVLDDSDPEELCDKMKIIINDSYLESILRDTGGSISFFLQPLKDIHLHSRLEAEFAINGDIGKVYFFVSIAILILIIACFNYVNLSTAGGIYRIKEIGIRKSLGAYRKNIIYQFVTEAFIQCMISLLLGGILIMLFLPLFFQITGFTPVFESSDILWGLIILGILLSTLSIIGGIYPGLYLSSLKVGDILFDRKYGGNRRNLWRGSLIIFQFTISVLLIQCSVIIFSQLDFIRNKDLGFNKDQVIYISNLTNKTLLSSEYIKANLLKINSVKSMSYSSSLPGMIYHKGLFHPNGFGEEESQSMDMLSIDGDFFSTLGIELVKGRNFSPLHPSDSAEAVIINDSAARNFGWPDPIGQYFIFNTDQPGVKSKMYVIGVVRDFHITSIKESIAPLFIENKPSAFNSVAIKISSKEMSETILEIERVWKKILPDQPFNYKFIDETFAQLYNAEERLSGTMLYFCMVSILLTSLGIFGISYFFTGKRIKEIGIRKVFGARIYQIFFLLIYKYTLLSFIAFLIASFLSTSLMKFWLNNFAYRVNIHWSMYLLTGIGGLIITIISISYQSIQVTVKNPVDSLRQE